MHSGTFCLSWIWVLYCSGCHPASCSVYSWRRPAPDYRLDKLGRPGRRQHSRAWGVLTHIRTLCLSQFTTVCHSEFEAKMTDSAGKVVQRRYLERENYSEVNDRNSKSLHSSCHSRLTTAFKRLRQGGCLTEVLQILRCTWFLPDTSIAFSFNIRYSADALSHKICRVYIFENREVLR